MLVPSSDSIFSLIQAFLAARRPELTYRRFLAHCPFQLQIDLDTCHSLCIMPSLVPPTDSNLSLATNIWKMIVSDLGANFSLH